MNQPRYDVYGPVHKGIRFLMTEVMYELGKADVNDLSELTSLEEKLQYLWDILKAHAEGEEEFLFPHLEKANKSFFTKMKQAHDHFHEEIEILGNNFRKIKETEIGSDEKVQLMSKFVRNYNTFLSQYFSHLQDEELDANPILWEVLSDNELMVVVPKIASKIAPEVMQYFMVYFLRAINHIQRIGILMGMQKNMPEPVFNGILNIAESSLEEADWKKLKQSLDKLIQVH
ncbi:MAG: hemerythrin domain-containing protein [Promethearchaeota archaeon]|jgi:iron-sulfur cluster repair protein YtfE (RIC family)